MSGVAVRPRIEAIVGPARSGKSAAAIARLHEAGGTLVVPSERQVCRMAAMLRASGLDACAPVGLATFVERLLKGANAGDAAEFGVRLLICQRVADAECRAGSYFEHVCGTRGFAPALAECIAELKRTGTTPDALAQAANDAAPLVRSPGFGRKAAEIAALHRAYERELADRRLYDTASAAARAAERVAQRPAAMRAVVFDGFTRFEPAWRGLLGALARAGVRVVVTLPYEERRPLLFAATASALSALRAEFDLVVTELTTPREDGRTPDLVRLERGLFSQELIAPRATDASAVRLFEAPNPYAEAEMVVRALRRAHDDEGVPWDRCAIVMRSASSYGGILPGICDRLGVPVLLGQAMPLRQHRLARKLDALLRVVLGGWMRDDVLAYLDAAVDGAGRLALARLWREARRRGLRDGAEAWEGLLTSPGDGPDAARTHLGDLIRQSRTGADAARSVATCVTWLRNALATGQVPPTDGAAEDAQALGALSKSIAHLERALRPAVDHDVGLALIRDLLLAQWEGARLDVLAGPGAPGADLDAERARRVLVLEPHQTRERDLDLVAVMGLTERVFPRRVVEDPFFREEEREAMRAHGIALEPRAGQADEERLRFYCAVTAPGRRLILSYPRASDDSDNLRSFFIDEVEAAMGPLTTSVRTLADVAPLAAECVDEPSDRLLCASALATGGSPSHRPGWHDEVLRLAGDAGLRLDDAVSAAIVRAIESRLLPPAPRIERDAQLSRYTRPRAYSISEIETYRLCPFKHFALSALRLREDMDPAGDARRGSIWHEALSMAMRDPRAGVAEDVDELRRLVTDALDDRLARADIDAPAYMAEMLKRSLREAVEGFAEREARYRQATGWRPTYHELAFGPQGRRPIRPSGSCGELGLDAASRSDQPLLIEAPDGPPIKVSGVIDRVDLAPDGTRALVLDYKTGRPPLYAKMRKGESIQLPVYLLAIERVWGLTGAAACYDSLRGECRPRLYRTQHVDPAAFGPDADHESGTVAKPLSQTEYDDMVHAAENTVRAAVAGIRSGDITPTAGDHCRFCAFGHVCRTTDAEGHDGEPLPARDEADADAGTSPGVG
ncbi:MAG TPA: PD-(D/E)XK nuclease family protein [Chthonomonadales bacterium]|nr:PD-(D/E)XK nuclease family protein [Chthonomonadales bacterium]